MSLLSDLTQAEECMTDELFQEYENRMLDLYMLSSHLNGVSSANGVLPYLYVELTGRARQSYISRIYGKYRKMLPKYDAQVLASWPRRQFNGKS